MISLSAISNINSSQSISNTISNTRSNNHAKNLNQDLFVKQSSQVSFSGMSEETKDDLATAAKTVGIAGAGFLLSLTAAVGTIKAGEKAADLFFKDDGFIVDKTKASIKSSEVIADADDGIFQVKGTGIDIRPERFDFVDTKKGIYKNVEKGIDIDLSANKYIDPEKGIFVDPEAKISTIITGDTAQNITIPDFSFGTGMWRSNLSGRSTGTEVNTDSNNITIVKGKVKDFFNVINPESDLKPEKDIFGREVIKTINAKGETQLLSIPDAKNNEVFKDFLDSGKSLAESAKLTQKIKFRDYYKANIDPDGMPFGTRLNMYEGGRNQGLNLKEHIENKDYDKNIVRKVMDNLKSDRSYAPEVNSPEAIEFYKFQQVAIENGTIKKPFIETNELVHGLIDIDGDGISEGIDLDGDGVPDQLFDINHDGAIDKEDVKDFVDKVIDIGKEVINLFKEG